MAVYCGVDIIEIDRVKQSLEATGDAFRDKVFTALEINYCELRGAARYQSYAARFAAKEAVSKALGTGISSGVSWKDIEVSNDERGAPVVTLYGSAKDLYLKLGALQISISLSHSKIYAVAYAVIEAVTPL